MDEIRTWQGDVPVFLLIVKEGQQIVIDVEEPQWIAKHPEIFAAETTWHLIRKAEYELAFSLVVHEGEKPYYLARHIGQIGTTNMEVIAYGIGCARRSGHTDRMWLFSNGQITMGEEDVYDFAHAMLAQRRFENSIITQTDQINHNGEYAVPESEGELAATVKAALDETLSET